MRRLWQRFAGTNRPSSAGGAATIAGARVSDPHNVESEIDGGDLDRTPEEPAEIERDLARLIEARFQKAAEARKENEGKWSEAAEYCRPDGDQFSRWNPQLKKMMRPPTGRAGRHQTTEQVNKILPKVERITAREIQGKISVSVSPLTPLDSDRAAVAEARAVLAHLDRLVDRASQDREISRLAVTVGPAFLKIAFDPTARVPAPQYDAADNLAGVIDAPLGEFVESVVSAFEIYPDPKARHVREAEWIIHAKTRSIGYLVSKWGDKAYNVKPDGGQGEGGFVDRLFSSLSGDKPRDLDKTATVKECWELPSARYQGGRFIVEAGGVILHAGPWPYAKLKTFPFVPLSYRDGLLSFWGGNATAPLIPVQRGRNQALGRMLDHLNNGAGKILAPRGCEIKPDDFSSGRPNEVIFYTVAPELQGLKPEFFPNEPLDPTAPLLVGQLDADLDDIASEHAASRGMADPNAKSGIAIQSLQDADLSPGALFHQNRVAYRKAVAEIELAIAAEMYAEPRLLFVQDDTQPGAEGIAGGRMRALMFQHLGQARLTVEAAGGTPETPQTRRGRLLEMATAGMFAPEQLAVTIPIIEQMELEGSERLTARLLDALRQIEANRPDPAKVAQIEAEHAAQMEAVKTDAAAQLEQTRGQIEAQQIEQQHENEIETLLIEHSLTTAQQEQQQEHASTTRAAEMMHDAGKFQAQQDQAQRSEQRRATTAERLAVLKQQQPAAPGAAQTKKPAGQPKR